MSYEALSSALKSRRGKTLPMTENMGEAEQQQMPAPGQQLLGPPHLQIEQEVSMGGPASLPSQIPGPMQPSQTLDNELHQAVTGGGTQEEYDQLKTMNPRSLGERAKMQAMSKQFGGK